MRKSKKQLMKSGIAGLLIASMAVGGGTLAYLTDSETAENTFTVGKVKISLLEPNYPGNNSEQVKDLVPNEIVKKDPQVQNTGVNDAIIYLKVEVPKADVTVVEDGGTRSDKKVQEIFTLKNLKTGDDGTWMEIRKDDSAMDKCVYVYAYKTKLTKDATTTPLFDEVQLKNVIEQEIDTTTQNIKINAYAIQADNILDVDTTTLDQTTLGKVYDIYVNQSGDKDKQSGSDTGDSKDDTKVLGAITYDLNGGTLTGEKTEYTAADYGYTPPTPTRENYTFTGWDISSIPSDSTGDIKFTATWTATVLGTIQYELDGGSITGEKTEYTVEDYGYVPPAPVKNGCKFLGWKLESIPVGSSRNLTFKAKWKTETTTTLLSGLEINTKMRRLAGYDDEMGDIDVYPDQVITAIHRSDEKTSGLSADENLISTVGSENPVYMWIDNGTIKWWSNAERVMAGTDLSSLCAFLSNLSDITGLSDWDVSNVESMSTMFYNCTNLTDASAINNWNITKVTNFNSMFENCPSHPTFTKRTGTWDYGTFTPTT